MENELLQLIEILETASPTVWAIARHQVLVVLIQSAIWLIAFIIATYICTRLAFHFWKESKKDARNAHDITVILMSMFAVIACLVALEFLGRVVGAAVNPDFCAVRQILLILEQ